jgi:hypothetical protein
MVYKVRLVTEETMFFLNVDNSSKPRFHRSKSRENHIMMI